MNKCSKALKKIIKKNDPVNNTGQREDGKWL